MGAALQADFEDASARHRATTRYFSNHMPIEDFDTLFQDFELQNLRSRDEAEQGTETMPLQPGDHLQS